MFKNRNPGTIVTLVFLLVASFGIRVFSGASEVLANSDTGSAEKASLADPAKDATAPSPDALKGLLKDFQEREARIEAEEARIAKELATLQTMQDKVDAKLAALETAEAELRATLELASTAAETDLTQLTAVYENMKPKTAAAVFNEMDPEFAAGFIGRMRPDTAAAILAGVDPDVAYLISTIIAGRNADVPD